MAYYQNPFEESFSQNWILDDRTASLNYRCPSNRNTKNGTISWNNGPFDLSTLTTLTFYYAKDGNYKLWNKLAINVSGATPSATNAAEVVAALNGNVFFTDNFTVSLGSPARGTNNAADTILIKAKQFNIKFYIENSGAESKIKFNKYAGVADLPTYMDRHTVANTLNYSDSAGVLVRLSHPISGNTVANPTVVTSVAHGLSTNDVIYIVNSNSTPTIDGQATVTVTGVDTFTIPVNVTVAGTKGEWLSSIEKSVVEDAELTYSDMKEDYEHLAGNSNAFLIKKNTVDASSRITQSIIYPTGSVVGGFAKKIQYTYTGAQTSPDTMIEIPYQLVAADLVTPS